MWDSLNIKTDEVFGLKLQLLDKEGGEIHAEIGPYVLSFFRDKIKEQSIYNIEDFNIVRAGNSYLTVHNPTKVEFNALTKVTEVAEPEGPIPLYKFSFTDLETITTRAYNTKYLTDVIGLLHRVGPLDSKTTSRGSDSTMREPELYLNRYRLELTVEDGSANVLVVLFDILAEILLNQKADALHKTETTEIDGNNKVREIMESVVGKEKQFTVKIDAYSKKSRTIKLTTSKVGPSTAEKSGTEPDSSQLKGKKPQAPNTPDAKGRYAKANAKKKSCISEA